MTVDIILHVLHIQIIIIYVVLIQVEKQQRFHWKVQKFQNYMNNYFLLHIQLPVLIQLVFMI